ncbi:universal stress protein [Micromonospora sp. CPCC 206061]|uniref:universal stress protein n=1 Tax=Micromonospora sp. CPCC 206061 TaxID=3122410 RepID=UPI002FF194C8
MIVENAPVVAGLKDMATDSDTIRLAAQEAASTSSPLHIVHAFVWQLFLSSEYGDDRELAHQMLGEAVALARDEYPSLTVTSEVVDGDPTRVLLRAANDAELLVLGGQGLARYGTDPALSVSIQVAARASQPVLFACGAERPGPIVVGVDGSADAAVGLEAAYDEARRRHTGVVVVHAEGAPCAEPPPPAVPAEHRIVDLPADEALIAESSGAQLVVVGAQGDRPTLLGPVTQAVLRHAHCPVLVARVHPNHAGNGVRRTDQALAS